MDYAFVGPKTDIDDTYIPILERLLRRRSETKVIDRGPERETLNEFITFLRQDSSGTVSRPIGDVLIGAHANIEADVLIHAFRGQQSGSSNFENLELTMQPPPPAPPDPTRSILIPPELVAPPVPPATARFVRFRGCNIGRLPKALLQLKRAFGNQLSVIAPKHFHAVHEVNEELDSPWGSWESMAYEFTVLSPRAVTGATPALRTAALRALYVARQAGESERRFRFADGPRTEVPNDRWAPWLKGLDVVNGGQSKQMAYRLKRPVAKKKTLSPARRLAVAHTGFTANPHKYLMEAEIPGSGPNLTPAQVQAARLAQLRIDLTADPRFQSSYGLPYYERTGFALEGRSQEGNVNAFVDGHVWTFTVVPVTETTPVQRRVFNLISTGKRVVYILLVPISEANPGAKPNTSPLLVNFYPNDANPPTPPARELPEVDGPHFKIV